MPEQFALYFYASGLALALIAWIWILIAGYRTAKGWGRGLLFFPPTLIFFLPLHWRRAWRPTFLLVIAGLIVAAPLVWNRVDRLFPNRERDKIVDGERHLTVTGKTDFDYSTLASKPDIVVLQMANPEVKDETLEYLLGMSALEELDLNNTQVSDQGLAVLAKLPSLEKLRLRGTPITDAGFRKHLLPLDRLKMLDLTGTKVTGKTVREWKAKQPDRKALK
jgi:hypothetical protein